MSCTGSNAVPNHGVEHSVTPTQELGGPATSGLHVTPVSPYSVPVAGGWAYVCGTGHAHGTYEAAEGCGRPVSSTDERITALLPLTAMGPTYSRGVTELLRDVALFTGRGELEAAEHYLLAAERCAGFISWDELEARDPFHRATAV